VAGDSKTPLAKKLGIKEGSRLALLSEPTGFRDDLGPLPDGVETVDSLDLPDGDGVDVDVIVLFSHALEDLRSRLAPTARRLAPAGGLWIAWPKKAAGLETDLGFAEVQRAGLDLGLVDNKVCAVSEVYSGLRFVVRKENRAAWAEGDRPVP